MSNEVDLVCQLFISILSLFIVIIIIEMFKKKFFLYYLYAQLHKRRELTTEYLFLIEMSNIANVIVEMF